MIGEGTLVFYIDSGEIHSGRVINVELQEIGYTFSIGGYSGCEGQYILASNQIGHTVFFSEEDAEHHCLLQ